jgi:hypothetical protein
LLRNLRAGTALAVSAYGDAAARGLLLHAARLCAARADFKRRRRNKAPPPQPQPQPLPSRSRADVNAHLRSLASETARLSPALLAQISVGAVARARAASRKFGQKLIFDSELAVAPGSSRVSQARSPSLPCTPVPYSGRPIHNEPAAAPLP